MKTVLAALAVAAAFSFAGQARAEEAKTEASTEDHCVAVGGVDAFHEQRKATLSKMSYEARRKPQRVFDVLLYERCTHPQLVYLYNRDGVAEATTKLRGEFFVPSDHVFQLNRTVIIPSKAEGIKTTQSWKFNQAMNSATMTMGSISVECPVEAKGFAGKNISTDYYTIKVSCIVRDKPMKHSFYISSNALWMTQTALDPMVGVEIERQVFSDQQ